MSEEATAEHNQKQLASGVDELIGRLRREGVEAGQQQAEQILAEARAEARRLLDKADSEARARLESARKEADAYRAAGEEALKTAMRDMVLEMKATLSQGFSADVRRLVAHELQEPQVLRQMILEIVGRARDRAGVAGSEAPEVILPEAVVGLEELRNDPEALAKGPLTAFVFGLTREMLQRGVSFSASAQQSNGIRVQLQDRDVILDLTESAVAALLLAHLQPRFRAILEGVVK